MLGCFCCGWVVVLADVLSAAEPADCEEGRVLRQRNCSDIEACQTASVFFEQL
jgi:hypothetical protein